MCLHMLKIIVIIWTQLWPSWDMMISFELGPHRVAEFKHNSLNHLQSECTMSSRGCLVIGSIRPNCMGPLKRLLYAGVHLHMAQRTCCAIMHKQMQLFWKLNAAKEDMSWEAFWEAFDKIGGIEELITNDKQRALFQTGVHVNGDPERVTAAAIDSAFPRGLSILDNTIRRVDSLDWSSDRSF